MTFADLLKMSASSLWRRKLRTVLTVLGVVVGTASIVVMISLGLGLQKTSLEQIEQYGGLTSIDVYSSEDGYYISSSNTSSDSQDPVRIDDAMIETLSHLEHVEYVTPVLSFNAIARVGVYGCYYQIKGVSQQALENMNLNLAEGTLPTSDTELQFLYGNGVIADFYNAKTGDYFYDYSDPSTAADVDLMNDTIFVVLDTDAYYSAGSEDENGNTIAAPKKYLIPACGLLAGDANEYSENSWYVLCNIDALKTQLKKVFKNKAIPGQPTNKNGKPYKEFYYSSAQVKVDDMNYVTQVQEEIQNLGLTASSNAEWMNQVKESSRSIQAALGGIGAVSLLVAAIGIANTMTMSIYERTKEIGIMKVLGCDLSSIRNMFLAEAGFIGLIGGMAGLILSYIISAIINFVMRESYSGISYIPPYLALAALVFAVVIGMLAGLFPSLRAMKLSPLAAIRNE